jgi:cell wall-associated NlpC family hydrolase
MPDKALVAAERAVAELRAELEGAYGWAHLDVNLELAPSELGLLARGVVAVPRVARRLHAALVDAVPEGFPVDVTGVRALSTGDFRALSAEVTPVFRLHPARGRELATELLPEDGPVELLAEHAGARLIRAMDATVGWVSDPLGPSTPAPRIAPAHGSVDGVTAAARAFLDAPYLLGGATRAGIDCSALVQRAFARGLGVRLPRHSGDQLAATTLGGALVEETGDLLFAWTEREGPCHVGIVVEGEPMTVLHASLSRTRVVEDPLDRFLEGAARSEVAPLGRVLRFHARIVGRPLLALPEPEPEAF